MLSTISCLYVFPRMVSKFLTSLTSKHHNTQKLPMWLFLSSFMPLVQSICYQSSSSFFFEQPLTPSITRLCYPSSWVLKFVPQHSSDLLLTWWDNHIKWHLLHADFPLVSYRAQCVVLFCSHTISLSLSDVISLHWFSNLCYADTTQSVFSLRNLCFCMNLRISGRHPVMDCSSSTEMKSHQDRAVVLYWGCIIMSRSDNLP